MPVSKVYKHADTYDTKCKICDKSEIGDEFYYLYICPVFQEDRNRLRNRYSMCSLAVSTQDSPAVEPRSNPGSDKILMSENLRLYTTSPVVMC